MQATRRPRAAARGPASGHTRPGPRGRQTIPAGRRRWVVPGGLPGLGCGRGERAAPGSSPPVPIHALLAQLRSPNEQVRVSACLFQARLRAGRPGEAEARVTATAEEEQAVEIQSDDPLAVAIVSAIRQGDVDAVGTLAGEHAGLARARIRDADGGTRSLLHVVPDWPGYFPGGPHIVRLLVDAGAGPNAAVTGSWHGETPLHWAASSDD